MGGGEVARPVLDVCGGDHLLQRRHVHDQDARLTCGSHSGDYIVCGHSLGRASAGGREQRRGRGTRPHPPPPSSPSSAGPVRAAPSPAARGDARPAWCQAQSRGAPDGCAASPPPRAKGAREQGAALPSKAGRVRVVAASLLCCHLCLVVQEHQVAAGARHAHERRLARAREAAVYLRGTADGP